MINDNESIIHKSRLLIIDNGNTGRQQELEIVTTGQIICFCYDAHWHTPTTGCDQRVRNTFKAQESHCNIHTLPCCDNGCRHERIHAADLTLGEWIGWVDEI